MKETFIHSSFSLASIGCSCDCLLPPTPCQLLAGNTTVITKGELCLLGLHYTPSFFINKSWSSALLTVFLGHCRRSGARERERQRTCCTFVALNKFHVRTCPRGHRFGANAIGTPVGSQWDYGTMKLRDEEQWHGRTREDPCNSDANPHGYFLPRKRRAKAPLSCFQSCSYLGMTKGHS